MEGRSITRMYTEPELISKGTVSDLTLGHCCSFIPILSYPYTTTSLLSRCKQRSYMRSSPTNDTDHGTLSSIRHCTLLVIVTDDTGVT